MRLSVDSEMRRARSHAKKGELAQAAEIYGSVLQTFPQNKRAQQELLKLNIAPAPRTLPQQDYDRLVVSFRQGKYADVVQDGNAAAVKYPDDFILQFMLGAAYAGLNEFDDAVSNYRRGLEIKPDYAQGHYNLGNVLEDKGAYDEAALSYLRALALKPDYADAHYNLGVVRQNQGALGRAAASYEAALKINPENAKTHNNLGVIQQSQGDMDQAGACYQRALEVKPDYAEAHNNLGGVHQARGALDDAAACYARATQFDPDYAEAHCNLGFAQKGMGMLDAAMASCVRALEIIPDYAEAHNCIGIVLQEMGAMDDALANYARAVAIKPDYAEAHNNLGAAQKENGAFDASVVSFRRALEINPAYAEAHANLGIVQQLTSALDESVANYQQALEINPAYEVARVRKLHQQAHMCDWAAIREDAALIPNLGIEHDSVPPFPMLVMEDDPHRNLKRSEKYSQEKYKRTASPIEARPTDRQRRLRIGYFSADFHNHATMHLMARLFSAHDRNKFEVFAYSYGADKQDEMRKLLVDTVDVFHDVRSETDEAVAQLARKEAIDIAIDLKGYTQNSRPGIFAYRAAPVQIAYLGYPGSTGSPFMDYLLADEIVIPQTHHDYYSENVICLPHSYQVNDNTRQISQRPMTRAEFGLPEAGFVFCCFNSNYKITPDEFDVWMRLLNKVEGSVLWLLKSNKWVESRLREEAETRGIEGHRIIFAERLPQDEHLARIRFAGLFLDTFICNAHTTASDALWAGVPLVTKLGQGFAARVGGSLLNAVGLPELITETKDEYETLAFELASDAAKLDAVKSKLASNRTSKPLFDTTLFARHIEAAYQQAFQRYDDNKGPAPFTVAAIPKDCSPSKEASPQSVEYADELAVNIALRDKVRQLLEVFSQGKLAEVVGDAEQLVIEHPGNHLLHDFLGVVNAGLKRQDKAIANHKRAIEIKPDHAASHYNLALVLQNKGALEAAETSLGRVIDLKPDYADAHYNLGLVLQRQGRLDAAVSSHTRVLEIDPDYDRAREQKLHQLAHMCDWAAVAEESQHISRLGIEGACVSPFSMLAMEDEPTRHLLRSERLSQEICIAKNSAPAHRPLEQPKKLRVGYFSADFYNHATMYLMANLFAAHDRNDFEIYAYSYGPDKKDEMHRHLVDNVQMLREVRDISDEDVAQLARNDAIDIAVDLKGHTQHARTGIFAFRAAPVQVAYLGYPGTLGAEYMDYLIADEVVIPPEQQQNYSEKIIYLPHSYQVNDNTRRISDRAMNRAEFGLPDDAFVFCCFNSNYKIGSEEFDIWMRLLNSIDSSVLWLLKSNSWAPVNLRKEAEARGVDGARIVFAERLPHDEHLARYRMADLFLDTFNYNAHTTASDALWAGLPLVTKLGKGFAARVGGSLLHAVGLPELITDGNADYEALALDLATNAEKLETVTRTLAENRTTKPLFDTELFARNIDSAYRLAYQRYFDGQETASFKVESHRF